MFVILPRSHTPHRPRGRPHKNLDGGTTWEGTAAHILHIHVRVPVAASPQVHHAISRRHVLVVDFCGFFRCACFGSCMGVVVPSRKSMI
jgi:hypothetical protein